MLNKLKSTIIMSVSILFFAVFLHAETISLKSSGLPLTKALLLLADQHRANMVLSPDIPSTPLNMTVNSISFDEALDIICKVSGLHWKKTDNVYLIYPNSPKYQEFYSQIVRYRFQHIHPKYILESLRNLFKKHTFSVNDHTPDLFIRGYFGGDSEDSLLSLAKSLDYPRVLVKTTLNFKALSFEKEIKQGIKDIDLNEDQKNIDLIANTSLISSDSKKSSQITTAVGETGSLFVGEEMFISQGQDMPPLTQKVGINVEVTPINAGKDGNIQLKLLFSSSRLSGIINNYPLISEEKFETVISVKSGVEQIVSLYENDNNNKEKRGVPFSGSSIFLNSLLKNGLGGISLTILCDSVYPSR